MVGPRFSALVRVYLRRVTNSANDNATRYARLTIQRVADNERLDARKLDLELIYPRPWV